MVDLGVNPEAVFPYQMLFRGKNADAEYLNFVAQLAKIINKHAPNLLRKIGEFFQNPWGSIANLWEWVSTPTKPTSFLGKLWSHISMATERVVTYLFSNPWLIIAIIVLIVVVWMLYQARRSQTSRGAPNAD
ncbi:hypothetical protein DM02DRAFT_620854 [Periconia macrospinosa]|uniref:Uncharacterized protein n=1 Tax=Periconia macrospinosa TaxID=97972 RepID=A0A2V1CYG8_9PLEO|nr:hypothetical protein DM02DRAFT_620854 [Periconia macrospinosa]